MLFLAQNSDLTAEVLVDHANGEVREQFCTLLKTVLKISSAEVAE